MGSFRSLACALALLSTATLAPAAGLDNAQWDGLLQRHVRVLDGGNATQVDYAGMLAERAQLREYLAATAAVKPKLFASWSKADQLALLINAYNAWTVELVLSGDPQIDSIKNLGSLFQSPWKQPFINLLGKTRSLDELEHELIRGEHGYQELRVHFALNCASIGCPALRAEAYSGAKLEQQLNDAQQHFLADRSRNRLSGDSLQVSSIFKWYREDFELNGQGLADYLAAQANALGLTQTQRQQLLDGQIEIEFLDYDWRLNRTP
ncbi:MAG: DUF547 domain-containing protein [Pseudomonas sp.]|uniref:DUF547 domain-containing protein n=1 Tax=Pseudomonas sp. TaxID=306 RepID=UPI002734DC00|nr:DUF547 domain-containing protein [Pseudomonas sp.]MDP3848044.1 DUF547 domain-containing protein [Pseudomonas sp.]